jgi:hypothetical protein
MNAQTEAIRTQLDQSLKRQEDILKKQGETLEKMNAEQKTLKNTVESLHNEVKELKEDHKKHECAIKDLADNQAKTIEAMISLEQELDRLEGFSRRNNVKIFGVPEGPDPRNENCAETVRDVLETYVTTQTWTPDKIERAHRLGRFNRNHQYPRPLIVKFQRWSDAMAVMKDRVARDSMFNQGIRLAQDLTKRQSAKLKQLKEEGKRGYYVNGRLRVNEDSPVADVLENQPTTGEKRGGQEFRPTTEEQSHDVRGAGGQASGSDSGRLGDAEGFVRPRTRSTTAASRSFSMLDWAKPVQAARAAHGGERPTDQG